MDKLKNEILIKFGEYEHMKNLFEKGEVYMNYLSFYREKENSSERYDPAEGAESIMQMKGSKMTWKSSLTGEDVLIDVTDGVGYIRNSNLGNLNVFCMFYHQTPDNVEIQFKDIVDSRVWSGFGDTAVIIWDAASFVTRIKNAAKALGLEHYRGLVKYIDLSNWHGEIGPFEKDLSFSHQKELRIAVFDKKREFKAKTINIGDISDIALLVPASHIENMAMECSDIV